ncbi:hypothetical protein [Streptomyces sp. NPDC054865]
MNDLHITTAPAADLTPVPDLWRDAAKGASIRDGRTTGRRDGARRERRGAAGDHPEDGRPRRVNPLTG